MNEKVIGLKKVKLSILIVILALLGGHVQANNPDSLATRWINGKKFVLHKIGAKETYSSLSRQYHVPVADIQAANPNAVNLKIGEIIYVPAGTTTERKSVEAEKEPALPKPAAVVSKQDKDQSTQTHVMQKGQTLYAVSRMYGMSVDDLKKLNGLTSNAVAVGQKLKVSAAAKAASEAPVEMGKATYESIIVKEVKKEVTIPKGESAPKEVPAPKEEIKEVKETQEVKEVKEAKETITTPVILETTKATENKSLDTTGLPKVYSNPGTSRTSVIEKDPKSGVEVEKVTEVGVATWLPEGELNQNKFYALHRTAPIGSIIKVTNRMNNNSVFVKVVGTLPDTGDNNAAIIKITQAAAQRIGAIDQKFTAELSYGLTR